MNFDEKFNKIKFCSNQIKHFEPDPFYVNHFFKEFLVTVIEIYQGIFIEANRDFGLFVNGLITLKNFNEKAEEKGDEKAIEFAKWFDKKYEEIHSLIIPNFIWNLTKLVENKQKIPNTKILLTSKNIYPKDPTQELMIGLKDGKIRSKLDLDFEFKKQLPLFLQLLNIKRKNYSEPKVNKNEVILRVFLDGFEEIEIGYAVEVYHSLLRKFVENSRKKIHELIICE